MGEERAAKMEAVRADGRQPFAARMRGLPEEEVIADFVETGRGPARGVMTELCRIDPSGMLQLSPALAARCDAHGWRLEHLGVTIGTVIHGPDLRVPQTEQEIETMYDVLLERKVTFFREQDLTLDQQVVEPGRVLGSYSARHGRHRLSRRFTGGSLGFLGIAREGRWNCI